MDYELNDQDRAEIIKRFFSKYGLWLVLGIVLIIIGFGINSYLQQRAEQRNESASMAYRAMLMLAQNHAKSNQLLESATTLIMDYPKTVYATMARLVLVNLAIEQGNLQNAESILVETLTYNKRNSLTPIITLRLARVMIAEGKLTQAIAILKDPPRDFAPSYALLTGDAELLANNQKAARASYLAAQAANQNDEMLNQLLAERLNSLGSAQ